MIEQSFVGCLDIGFILIAAILFAWAVKWWVVITPEPKQMSTSSSSAAWHSSVNKFLYINLDSRSDRRKHIESVLFKHIGLPESSVERVPAILNSPGWLGCTKSHLKAIQTAMDRNYEYVCILEDDFMPLVDAGKFHATIQAAWDHLRGNFDVLMLGMTPVELKRIGADPLFRINACLSMPGYIVSRRFMPTLKSIAEQSIRNQQPIDMITQLYQSKSHWYGFFPPIARQMPGYSDIEKRNTDYAYLEIQGQMLTFM